MERPMTVIELIALLSSQPENAKVAWVDGKEGTVGYFFASEQQDIAVDNGQVHLELGGAL